MHDFHLSTFRRPSLLKRSLLLLAGTLALAVLGLASAQRADAQSSLGVTKYRNNNSGYRSQGNYRGHGHYRGATQTAPRATPFLQPAGLAGIRPQGFGRFEGGTPQQPAVVHPAPVAPGPRVIYLPVGVSINDYFPRSRTEPPVVVVQQAPPPPPQQPVVVMVPPPTPDTQPAPVVAPSTTPEPSRPAPPPKPKEPGLLTILIHPAEAEVFLDDRRLRDLDDTPRTLEAGVHVLEISHPDFPNERLVFGMGSAGNVEIEIDLRESKSGRRTRLRETSS